MHQIGRIGSKAPASLEVRHAGLVGVVKRDTGPHPSSYLFIHVGEKKYFLPDQVPGMTRGQVRALAKAQLERLAAAG